MIRKSVWLLSAGIFVLATPALGQTTSQSNTDTDQGAAQPTQGATAEAAAVENQAVERQSIDTSDIVITATRRNEALSDVPMAVSAVTAESLENTGATDIRQLQQLSPSLLVFSTQSEGGASRANIRGIGTVGDNPGLESSVGIFIDGVYRSRVGSGLTELGPVERIEVLRGPQGTLFGRNTSAGLISIITAKPRFQPEITGQLDVGNYDMRRVEVSATGPLSDTIAARLDGVMMKRDGFVEDLISGRDVNNRDRWLLRGQVLFQPSDDFSFRLIGDYSKRDEECCAAPYLPASDALGDGSGDAERVPSTFKPLIELLGGTVPDDPFERDVVISPGRSYRGDVKDFGLSGEAVYDFDFAELTSITAYRSNKLVRGTDVDYSDLDFIYRPDDGTAFNRFKTFTQELRLQGNAWGDRLDWLVGGYYANEKLRSQDALRYGEDFDDLSSCLAANSFARLTAQPSLISPTNPTCFNPLVATGVRNALVGQFNANLPGMPGGNPALLAGIAQQITALGAFARLDNSALPTLAPFPVPANFQAPIFTNSGFENLVLLSAPTSGFRLADTGIIADDFRQTANHWALFTHNIFSITDQIKLTVGARYTHEKKKLDATLLDNNLACSAFSGGSLAQLPCANPSVFGNSATLAGTHTDNKLSGTVVLSYKPTDRLLTYASYAHGYKAGGFNLDRSALSRQISLNSFGIPIAGQVCPTSGALPTGCAELASADQLDFKPEINDALELGGKFNGRGLDVNVAVFRQLFKDFQLNTFNGVNFIVENINACKDDLDGADSDNNSATGECTGGTRAGVKSRGIEVELFSRPLRNVTFNLGTTLADTKYRSNLVGADGRPLTSALFQLPGRRVSGAALWTVTSSFAWTPPIGSSGLRGLFYVDMRHQSRFNTGSDLDLEKIENGYVVVNGRVGIHGPDDRWAVELWAQNLFDEDVKQVAFDAFLQGSCTERGAAQGFCLPPLPANRSNQLYGVFLGEPRLFGVTLRTKLGFAREAAPVYVAPPAPPPPVIEQPAPPPPPPPPPPPVERGERGQ